MAYSKCAILPDNAVVAVPKSVEFGFVAVLTLAGPMFSQLTLLMAPLMRES